MTQPSALAPTPCPPPPSAGLLVAAGGVLLVAAVLAACGGGSDGAPESSDASNGSSMGATPPGESADPAPDTQASAPPPAPSAPPSAAAPPPAPTPTPAPSTGLIALDASTSCGISGFQADLLQRINAARATARQCGPNAMPAAAPLSWHTRLFSAAARHSKDMAENNYFSHTSLDGRSMGQRVSDEGYAWKAVGENIAAGQSSVNVVMSGWLSSPGHCANIMRATFTQVAVACVHQTGSSYGRYWTMVLAKP
ncbi:MAG TPA: CAP domain-containing protein [Hydrogenophaga sp.]|nr:CAP domain-containing protein [Hydrogenophaga sp.]